MNFSEMSDARFRAHVYNKVPLYTQAEWDEAMGAIIRLQAEINKLHNQIARDFANRPDVVGDLVIAALEQLTKKEEI